ncbi:MBL fold metallo-hydrolase [Pseudodesulfovibrio thermohalotolerans]|uniref:MBL fold metallo-hydrolase n=1 Tax=Pseudodesulfovibrio thermohalotolerans TaxID=2880651 RepID=UPI0024430B11|nr:MBL fold metallo-hydrolase [Pseudodesulfovibrio thermohalotolerans]WFS63338.1 MBL fold metallo-hydrolase [Pseudodesulfovibrio thermohalotolerans]
MHRERRKEGKNVTECIDIDLVANAGVLVRGGGLGLLVDGVHDEGGHPFSRVGPDTVARMVRGEGVFADLDYLLFTHEHPDHFTPKLTLELLRRRPVRGVLLPDAAQGSSELARFTDALVEMGVPHWPLGLAPGCVRRVEPEPGLAVTAVGARHMGPKFRGVRNDCLLVTLDGMNLLFTGDADHVPEYYEDALRDVDIDAVFVNPIFYHNPDGQAVINDTFRPREVFIYHMPPKDDDPFHLVFTVKRALERHARPDMPVRVLDADNAAARLCRAGT